MKQTKRILFLFMISVILTLPISYFIVDWKGLYVSTLGYRNLYLIALHKQSLSGDVEAMYLMAQNHNQGWNGLEVDYEQAREWYQKAYESGHPAATNNLALMYKIGEGVEQDYEKAITLFSEAIELGSLYAYSNLGSMYKNGEGVNQDYKKAFALFKTCTDKSTTNVYCLGNLGWMYHDGLGTEQSYEKAFYSWLKAAKQDNAPAQFQIGYFYDVGKGQIEKDRLKALEWYRKSASQDYAEAQRFIGHIYYDGVDGIPQDYFLAGKYFSMAALNGSKKAKKVNDYNIRQCEARLAGKYVKNYIKSCKLAVYSGNEAAKIIVAKFFYNRGRNFSNVNPVESFESFKKSADLGHSRAQYRLGMLYYNGAVAEKNNMMAYAYLKLSINKKTNSDEHYDEAKKAVDVLNGQLTHEQLEEANAIYQHGMNNLDLYNLH